MLKNNVKNREKIISSLHEELIGPTIDFSNAKELSNKTKIPDAKGLFCYKNCGILEEIHYRQPQRHYSAGLLYPLGASFIEADYESEDEIELKEKDSETTKTSQINSKNEETSDSDNEENQKENMFLPTTFGFTFAVSEEEKEVAVRFTCGFYEQIFINNDIQNRNKDWWFRQSLEANFKVPLDNNKESWETNLSNKSGEKKSNLKLRLDSLVRRVTLNSTGKVLKLVTISATNISEDIDKRNDSNIMFQCNLKAGNLVNGFQPYPSAANLEAKINEEDKKFDLLYSSERNYGFGQNCSTNWKEQNNQVSEISTTFLPEYEIKTMTPDIVIDGEKIEITYASLAAAENYEELQTLLSPLIEGYKNWYLKLTKENVLSYYEKVYQKNLREIELTIKRIEKGMHRLTDPKVFNCFRLVNLVMLMQMSTGKEIREIIDVDGPLQFDKTYHDFFSTLNFDDLVSLSFSINREKDTQNDDSPWNRYKWRGFQIAFLLTSIESFFDKDSEDRTTVDLIWFPTGGGKTEAYLSTAAFSMIYRRLINPEDKGTDIIMRYTLRLLTTDQFHRTARLMCSLEFLRKKFPDLLGETEFSLGMWVGKQTTPNTIEDAKSGLHSLIRGDSNTSLFPIQTCPWCGAEMKVVENKTYYGYTINSNGLLAHCPDERCPFHKSLPIYFIDEQLYKNSPTFLIGTIDKFVQLTWVPKARKFFGLNDYGKRVVSPPNLIIQDELHLISGPLGTLTGMYESLIEELSIDRRKGKEIYPKIICATATIKAYEEQIQSLFARNNTSLFPPSGKDINDNYFSTIQKNSENKDVPGRKYVGFYPFTQGKLQTEVQVKSSILAAVQALPTAQRDPFWTILSFYNTINDIGKGLTLTEQDIPSNLKNFYEFQNVPNSNRRTLINIKELTSRLDSGKIGTALSSMRESYKEKNNSAIDIVLASNIVEVGVDIDRLSLMTISGQPKTTAQYIQVSGRIGRKVNERPGLVITEYNPLNSNDKSHFEHFNEFHQRLYSQVEESSVTPFSRFAIKRGLPAVIVGYIRQNFDIKRLGYFLDSQYLTEIKTDLKNFLKRLLARAERVDNTEVTVLKDYANKIVNQLLNYDYDDWEYKIDKRSKKPNNGFMVRLSKEKSDVPETVLPVMFSMRSVDSVSKLTVTSLNEEMEDLFL